MSNIQNYLKTLVDTKYFEEEKMSDYIEAIGISLINFLP